MSTTSIQNWEKDTIPDKKYWAKLAYVLNLDFDIVSQYAPVKGKRNPCPDLLKRKREFIKFVEDNTTYAHLTDFDKEIIDKALTIIMLLHENITQQKYRNWNEFLYTNAKELEDISNYILLQKVYKIIIIMKDGKGWDKGNYLLREEANKYIAIGRKDKNGIMTRKTIDEWLLWSPKDNEKLSSLILILSNIIVNYSLKEDKEVICIELSDDELKELQVAEETLANITQKKAEAQKVKEELKKELEKTFNLVSKFSKFQNRNTNEPKKTDPPRIDILTKLTTMEGMERATIFNKIGKAKEQLRGTTDITNSTKGFTAKSLIVGIIGDTGKTTATEIKDCCLETYGYDLGSKVYDHMKGLVDMELLEEREVKVGGTGRPTKHYALTQLGKYVWANDNGKNPVESKIDTVAREQKSASHGLGINKVIGILEAVGYECDTEFARTAENGQDTIADIVATRNKRMYYIEFEEGNYNEAGYYTKFENILSIANHIIFITSNDETKRKIKTCWQRFCMKDFARYNSTKVIIATLSELQQDPYLLEK